MISNDMIGNNVLVTTDGWFFAPDGRQYRAVFGRLNGILTDAEALGVKTNARSTNWYARVGKVMIAGCQIHYAIESDQCQLDTLYNDEVVDGQVKNLDMHSRIYHSE